MHATRMMLAPLAMLALATLVTPVDAKGGGGPCEWPSVCAGET
jgi:hypothetical protein